MAEQLISFLCQVSSVWANSLEKFHSGLMGLCVCECVPKNNIKYTGKSKEDTIPPLFSFYSLTVFL